MPVVAPNKNSNRVFRFSFICAVCLLLSWLTLAQVTLKFRPLNGYLLGDDAPVNKGKPTLFVFEQADTFGQVFNPANVAGKRPDRPNFTKEMVIGVALPPTNVPPKLSISKVFVQDSTLTVRYIRIADTVLARTPQALASRPTLLLALPKQTVLKTRLVENGKVVQTLKRRATDE